MNMALESDRYVNKSGFTFRKRITLRHPQYQNFSEKRELHEQMRFDKLLLMFDKEFP